MAILLEDEPTQGVTNPVNPDQENFATLEKKRDDKEHTSP
jgi:hypothetical protein